MFDHLTSICSEANYWWLDSSSWCIEVSHVVLWTNLSFATLSLQARVVCGAKEWSLARTLGCRLDWFLLCEFWILQKIYMEQLNNTWLNPVTSWTLLWEYYWLLTTEKDSAKYLTIDTLFNIEASKCLQIILGASFWSAYKGIQICS